MSNEPMSPSMRRLIDASLNRLAEALRTVEDVCRFHWNQRAFSGELKELRHAVLSLFLGDSSGRVGLAQARDIEGDVGREISSPVAADTGAPSGAESSSSSSTLDRVAIRNLQRAKESLRSLEEVSRAHHGDRARAIEAWRYRLYSIEKGILHLASPASARRSLLQHARLCLLWTRSLVRGDEHAVLEAALDGGVDVVQMREKNLDDRDALILGRELRARTAARGALLIVNDRPDLARLVEADGVHLGQEDLPVHEARRIVGSELLIGVSTHSEDQLRAAIREGADYVGIGPVFPTTTKDAGPCLGMEAFSRLIPTVTVPSFAIGGIDADNIGELADAGASGVAVCSAILGTPNAEASGQATRDLRVALERRAAEPGLS